MLQTPSTGGSMSTSSHASVKPVRLFFGTLSNGVHTEAAMRIDGVWFHRFYEFNGYAKAWTRWVEFTPTWETKIMNAYTGEETPIDEGCIMSCGFGRMTEIEGKMPAYRLPV